MRSCWWAPVKYAGSLMGTLAGETEKNVFMPGDRGAEWEMHEKVWRMKNCARITPCPTGVRPAGGSDRIRNRFVSRCCASLMVGYIVSALFCMLCIRTLNPYFFGKVAHNIVCDTVLLTTETLLHLHALYSDIFTLNLWTETCLKDYLLFLHSWKCVCERETCV